MHNHKLMWLDGVAQPENPGECRDCDVDFFIPKNLRAMLEDGTEIPVEATYGGLTKQGAHEWIVVVPETRVSIEGFEADSGLQQGHVLSFVGDAWVREQERRRQAALESDGPESGPLPDGEVPDE